MLHLFKSNNTENLGYGPTLATVEHRERLVILVVCKVIRGMLRLWNQAILSTDVILSLKAVAYWCLVATRKHTS